MPLYPEFKRLYRPAAAISGPVKWLPMRGRDLIVRHTGKDCALLTATEDRFMPEDPLVLGEQEGVTYLACDAPADLELPDGWKAIDLWRLHGSIPEQDWVIAGYAAHILHWRRTSAYCPVCGHIMGPMGQEWMRECPQCKHQRYPQISLAVLILVHDGADRVLLSHQPGWGEMYSILAGFVLPGESLEECVHREVEEEVSVQVTDLVYAGSQPWPFPQQLMIGFTARYAGGEIRIDEQELDRAAWFAVGELPPLPPTLSLSRRMIDAWRQSRNRP
jgi:NAD+ diphosphatase